MKKVLSILTCFLFLLSLVACGGKKEEEKPDPTPPVDDNPPVVEPSDKLPNDPELTPSSTSVGFAIHFNINTMVGTKPKYNLWIWELGKDGKDYQFTGSTSYGIVARYKWEEFSTTAETNGLGFIVKENKVWADGPSKDVEADRFIDFSTFELDQYGYYNIYLKSGEADIYINATGDINDVIKTFNIFENAANDYRVWFQTNNEFSDYKIYCGQNVIFSKSTEAENQNSYVSVSAKQVVIKLGSTFPNLNDEYKLEVTFAKTGKTHTKVAEKTSLYRTKYFADNYTYTGKLGAIYSASSTTFRVWSPISTKIDLRIYNSGTPANLGGNDEFTSYSMTKGEKGTWEYVVSGNLEGKYYTYVVTNGTYKEAEIVDPYAKSTGLNGLRGMIVDFSKTNPTGWDEVSIKQYSSTQLTVYETHIADLTSSSTWGGTATNAKLYKGFYESGTTYTENGVTVKTGFDHIKELGVNAVQILPFFDQANDERVNKREFNWGYNPLNYNALDGIYSSDPSDGYVKIREFKELVKAYNEAGINIIMDVVYNHVSGLEKCNFDVLMPKYYFRYTSNGVASNGSGCGNETASDMPMFRKFMIDSTEFWASEYKLGGFRFDLMGIHDIKTMNDLAKNLHDNVSEYITIYGEPWAGGTTALPDGNTAALQISMDKYEGYGCFNDKMRDALIKGGLNSVTDTGWITNNSSVSIADVANIKSGLTGLVLSNSTVLDPSKCVNYVTCHDNYTLYDRIKAAGITDETTIKKMAMLANSVVFTSQGVNFMLAGEEFLRTKGGNENSYNASYKVNELNYSLKVKNLDMFNNYKVLIALKKAGTIFNLTSEQCKKLVVNINSNGSMIYYDIVDSVNNKTYRIIHSNGVSATDKVVNLAGYTLVLDTLNSNVELKENTNIENYQTIIAVKSV